MLRDIVVRLLVKETGRDKEAIDKIVEVPPDPKLGDFSFPCFRISKDPVKEARRLADRIRLSPAIERIEVKGPYLNFFLRREHVAEAVLGNRRKSISMSPRRKIVVEYCGPNTNKPLHLGHLRNMSLGNAMCRMLAFAGHDVHPVNIVNDRGVHICQSMLAYQKWGKGMKPNRRKGDHFVGDFYVLYAKELQKNPGLEHEAQELLRRWESNERDVLALWKKMNGWVLKGFAETYRRFGISFEKEYFESEYYEKGKAMVEEGVRKGFFLESEKGILAPLKKYGLTDKIVLRTDGTSIYITQDMYLAEQRFRDFHFDQMMYVVASEQNLHFRQLFAILDLLRKPFAKNLFHLSYGLVNLPSGRMKSREGTVVDADDLMDEVVALAEKEIDARHPGIPAKEKKKRAEMIGLGALKFFLLKTDPVRDMVFNPEESIRFDGETGPYIQYTHARACSLLKKAGMRPKRCDYGLLRETQEQEVIKLLAEFQEHTADAVSQCAPHTLCHYLLRLAQAFNEFYHSYPVISDEKNVMQARLVLVDAVRHVLKTGLGLLGISAPEEM